MAATVETEPAENAGGVVASATDGRRGDPFVVNRWLQIVERGPDEVTLRTGYRSHASLLLRDDGAGGFLPQLLRAFRTPATVDGAIESVAARSGRSAAEVSEMVDALVEQGVLVPYETSAQGSLAALDGAVIVPLAIKVLGSGALAVEVERIVTTDLAGSGAIERHAIEDGQPDLSDLFAQAGVVVVALDRFSPMLLHQANAAALRTGTPWIAAYVDGLDARVGPVFVPGRSACYAETEALMDASTSLASDDLAYRDALRLGEVPRREGFRAAAVVAIAAGWTAVLVNEVVLGRAVESSRRQFVCDAGQLSMEFVGTLRLPRCPACRNPQYRQVFA